MFGYPKSVRVCGMGLLSSLFILQSGCGIDYLLTCEDDNPFCLRNVAETKEVLESSTSTIEWNRPPMCPEDPELPSYDVGLNENCRVQGVVGTMDPIVEWAWTENELHPGYDQVMMTPVAGNMTDDNGDGVIDAKDTPDIAFTTFTGGAYPHSGALNVLSGDTGELLWSKKLVGGFKPEGSSGVALADLGDGEGLALFLMTSGGLTAVNVDGTPRWTAPYDDFFNSAGYAFPAVYDMEGDGVAEIIVGRSVYEADGVLRWRGEAGVGSGVHISYAMDLDEDGLAEVIAGDTIYNYDGTVQSISGVDGYTAVADLNADGRPDIVTVSDKSVVARDLDGSELWNVNYTTAGLYGAGGGPPTIADFNGDGKPEVGVASSSYYRVFNGLTGTLLWQMPIVDSSSRRTSSSVFDFEGDGAAEVVYADEHTLWVFDGATGDVEMEWDSHSSGTLFEYPIIVDVDNDGSSEIVVVSNNLYGGESTGITVIGDENNSWAPARPIWNQHAYSISNINDDGTVPVDHPAHWLDRNNFRAGNSETQIGYEQFDLMVGEPVLCFDECSQGRALVWIPIANGGLTEATDIVTTVYATDQFGDLQEIDSETLPRLNEGEQSWLDIPVELLQADFEYGGVRIEVQGQWPTDGDCELDNNVYHIEDWPCLQ